MSLRNHSFRSAGGALLALAVGTFIGTAAVAQTPSPNSAVLLLRVFNDCPFSVLTTQNLYPAGILIQDANLSCAGFANLHLWQFSEDGATGVLFPNNSCFEFAATLSVFGPAEGEGGLQISPWYSDTDGRFNVRTTDGEIACFGGRLPFYSFTAQHGLHYTKGTEIGLHITYLPNGLSLGSPGTIEYEIDYQGNHYTSGPLAFDEGNPDEDPPYGLWGILNDSQAGGHFQPFLQAGNPNAALTADWKDITFNDLCEPVSVDAASWGRVKGLYR